MSLQHFLEPEYDYDFELIALRSTLRPYRMAWLLNKNLGLSLCHDGEAGCTDHARVAVYLHEIEHRSYRLVNNRSFESGDSFLLPEISKEDFLFLIEDPAQSISVQQLLMNIKEIEGVENAHIIDVNTLQERENLLL